MRLIDRLPLMLTTLLGGGAASYDFTQYGTLRAEFSGFDTGYFDVGIGESLGSWADKQGTYTWTATAKPTVLATGIDFDTNQYMTFTTPLTLLLGAHTVYIALTPDAVAANEYVLYMPPNPGGSHLLYNIDSGNIRAFANTGSDFPSVTDTIAAERSIVVAGHDTTNLFIGVNTATVQTSALTLSSYSEDPASYWMGERNTGANFYNGVIHYALVYAGWHDEATRTSVLADLDALLTSHGV